MIDTILALAWEFLNSGPGLTLLGGLVLGLLNAVYARRPGYKAIMDRFEGTIISAVRAAEKAIPDGTPMKGAERLDKALKLVLAVYESRTGTAANPATIAMLAEAVQVVHSRLESEGALEGPEL